MTESPKKRFLLTPHAKALMALANHPAILAGFDAAILQMSHETGAAKSTDMATALHWQLTGAFRLREMFLTIATPEKPLLKTKSDNLPHET